MGCQYTLVVRWSDGSTEEYDLPVVGGPLVLGPKDYNLESIIPIYKPDSSAALATIGIRGLEIPKLSLIVRQR